MEDNQKTYFAYLKGRSRLGLLYRNCFLYPRISLKLRGKVLDVGCGIGDFVRFRQNTAGVDINQANVDFCQQQGLSVQRMPLDQIPHDASSFDAVVLDNVLEHISNPDNLLEEVFRIVRPGGQLMVGVPGKKGYQQDDDHKVFYDHEKLQKTVNNAGFVFESSFYTPFKSSYLDSRLSQYCLYALFNKPDDKK